MVNGAGGCRQPGGSRRHLSGGRRRLGTCRFGFGAAAMMIAAFDSGGMRHRAPSGVRRAPAASFPLVLTVCLPGPVWRRRHRLTGPENLTICSKVTSVVHLPADRAATARMLSWYFPLPLIPAYLPVPPKIL